MHVMNHAVCVVLADNLGKQTISMGSCVVFLVIRVVAVLAIYNVKEIIICAV